MKPQDYLKQMRAKTPEQLDEELTVLRREQFNLRLQYASGQNNKTHLASDVRQRIARLKTVMAQQAKAKSNEQAKAS